MIGTKAAGFGRRTMMMMIEMTKEAVFRLTRRATNAWIGQSPKRDRVIAVRYRRKY
jgi:hypothetical protein